MRRACFVSAWVSQFRDSRNSSPVQTLNRVMFVKLVPGLTQCSVQGVVAGRNFESSTHNFEFQSEALQSKGPN